LFLSANADIQGPRWSVLSSRLSYEHETTKPTHIPRNLSRFRSNPCPYAPIYTQPLFVSPKIVNYRPRKARFPILLEHNRQARERRFQHCSPALLCLIFLIAQPNPPQLYFSHAGGNAGASSETEEFSHKPPQFGTSRSLRPCLLLGYLWEWEGIISYPGKSPLVCLFLRF
jgi:hypothetical protein